MKSKRSPVEKNSAAAGTTARFVASAIVATLTVVVYAPVRDFGFVNFDDGLFVTQNRHVATGLSAANISWAFTHPYEGTGGPLTWISHMLDVQLFGLDAGWHHLVNLGLHVMTAVLLLWLLASITGALWRSTLVAVLFAVHPLHVESVAWIAERKDVLSGLLWVATIAAYAFYTRRRTALRYALVFVTLTAGLLAKPMLVTVPAVLLLLDIWPLKRIRSDEFRWPDAARLIGEKVPLCVPALLAIGATYVTQVNIGAASEWTSIPPSLRVGNALVSYVYYLWNWVWPAGLAVFYPYPHSLSGLLVAACAVFIGVTSLMAVRLVKSRPYLTVGWFWYLLTLLPVIGLVQVGGHARADRFTYMPLVGIFIVASWGMEDLRQRTGLSQRLSGFVAVAIVLALSVVSSRQVETWRDSATLWRHALAVTAGNDRAHANLGVVLATEGQSEAAIGEYEEALRLNPTLATTHNNLGQTLALRGQRAEAEEQYREAIELDAAYVNAHHNLGVLLADEGRFQESLEQCLLAVKLDPDDAEAHMNLALTYRDLGDARQAVAHVRQAIALRSDNARWHLFAGTLLMETGARSEAVSEAEAALRLDPNLDAARDALRNWSGGR